MNLLVLEFQANYYLTQLTRVARKTKKYPYFSIVSSLSLILYFFSLHGS